MAALAASLLLTAAATTGVGTTLHPGGGDALGAGEVRYHWFDPMVVDVDVIEDVLYRVQTDGTPDRVEVVLAQGPTVALADLGGGLFATTLTHDQVLFGYDPAADFNHNFAGYLDVYSGAVRLIRGNLFVNVLDANVPPITVVRFAPDMIATDYLVGLHLPGADVTALDLEAVARRFYGDFDDTYDFLAIVSWPTQFANRFYASVQNAVGGIGIRLFDASAIHGSSGSLQGIIRYPITGLFDLGERALVHEIGHQWINFLDAVPALQGVTPHWPVSSLARSVMGWNSFPTGQGLDFPYRLVPLGGDDYQIRFEGEQRAFHDLDLYLMGLLPEAQVGDHFVFTDQGQALCDGCTLLGPVARLSAADVVAAYGPRTPAWPDAPTAFRAATILVSTEREPTPREMAFFSYFARRGEATTPLPYSSGFASGTTWPFWLATGQRATLTTRIDRVQLRRDASITGLEPRPDLGSIFPLPVYRDPAPRAPFTDEPDLLTDASRPLVLYQWSADRVMALVKDLSPGVNSVRIVR